MKPSYFSNKKSLQIVSSSISNDIKGQIRSLGSFNLNSKYYTFLNKKNVNDLKEPSSDTDKYLVTLSTFGKKFVLFMTRYNSKKYCIFINKKNEAMTVLQLKFTDDIFNGTLFDGELVKNNEEKWIYLINDIAYYKGENIITTSFMKRQEIIKHIIQYEQDTLIDEHLNITNKQYFTYKNIKDLCENYINHLNYKCSGLYFKSINNFSNNYLFIFPECRSDSKILNTYEQTNDNTNKENKNNKENELDLFDNVEIIETIELNKSNDKLLDSSSDTMSDITDDIQTDKYRKINISNTYSPSINKIHTLNISTNITDKVNKKDETKEVNTYIKKSDYKLEKTTCKFIINPTIMPDIYELYCKNSNNQIEKYSYAGIPDITTSRIIKDIISNANFDRNEDINTRYKNDKSLFVECTYHKAFKKWVPYKKVDSVDTINTINQIQIILDSL